MPKLVQINVSLNWGSTGKIAEGISSCANEHGWECYTVHGHRFKLPSKFPDYQVSTYFEELLHYTRSLLFDQQGLGSKSATKRLIKWLKEIKPDIIHLHVIHGCYLNYPILFNYINQENIPVVWTFHDCWAFTGHCVYFDRVGCTHWQKWCHNCPQTKEFPKSLLDCSNRNYNLKKSMFERNKNLTIVSVSSWLGNLVSKSFLKGCNLRVIHNGIDITRYKPSSFDVRKKYNIDQKKKIILAVANGFGERKGIHDFVKLSKCLPSDCLLVMVGVLDYDSKLLTNEICAIERTDNQQDLIDLYSSASVFINPTYEDNFPTTNLESLACGTPVITYDTGGSPEAIDNKTGLVVKQGDVEALKDAITTIINNGKDVYSSACRERAEQCFDQNERFKEYIELYHNILQQI